MSTYFFLLLAIFFRHGFGRGFVGWHVQFSHWPRLNKPLICGFKIAMPIDKAISVFLWLEVASSLIDQKMSKSNCEFNL